MPSEKSFPLSCRQTLTGFILSLSDHLSRKRPADPFLDFFANSTSIVIIFLNELSAALRTAQGEAPAEAVQRYLRRVPDSNLANVLSTRQQERKLNLVADDILQTFLDSKAYNCPPVKTFLREILAAVVLEMTITSCSKPEWINGWIVYLLEYGEPEIMNAIDAGVENMGGVMNDLKAETSVDRDMKRGHQRRVSNAEKAMQDAVSEARRLNEMIAEEDARRKREATVVENEDTSSTVTTDGMATPTSSEDDRNRNGDKSGASSMVLERSAENSPRQPTTPITAGPSVDLDQLALSGPLSPSKSSYALQPDTEATVRNILTLQNASVTIHDDGDQHDKSVLRAKPTTEYMLQIEPASSRFPGWMISRNYTEFETLHEVLRRISIISGVNDFAQKHTSLPTWKGQSQAFLTQNLERYIMHALRYEPLAESEAMKKFLEKDTGLNKTPSGVNKNVLGFQGPAALETMGKGFINVLGQAPKGLVGSGKAVMGGVQGVFGAVATGVGGQKKPVPGLARSAKMILAPTIPRSGSYSSRTSLDSITTTCDRGENNKPPPLPSRPQGIGSSTPEHELRPPSVPQGHPSQESLRLPPPPSDMPDDYHHVQHEQSVAPPKLPARPNSPKPTLLTNVSTSTAAPEAQTTTKTPPKAQDIPLTDEETRVSIELIFAIITELYSLSSAWTIRLSLLSAAKTFLLRPNNPQLESIRSLLQDSILDANLSDAGLAAHLLKLRENTLPTEEELKKWPGELSLAGKEKLRIKARKLLVERGMPQALVSVMGTAASGEALGRVFDCLQVPEVARGLVFALLLQALKALTQ